MPDVRLNRFVALKVLLPKKVATRSAGRLGGKSPNIVAPTDEVASGISWAIQARRSHRPRQAGFLALPQHFRQQPLAARPHHELVATG
jgi:hypothetical protein